MSTGAGKQARPLTSFAETYPSIEAAHLPFPLFEALRSEAPVSAVPGFPGDFLVARHGDIVEVLGNPEVFASDLRRVPADTWWSPEAIVPNRCPHMLATDPPEHKRRRSLATPAFTPRRIRTYAPMIRDVVDELIDTFIEAGEVHLIDQFATPLPIVVFSRIFGLPAADIPILRRLSTGSLENDQSIRYLTDEQKEIHQRQRTKPLLEGGANDAGYFRDKILERHAHPLDDGLSLMVRAQVERDGELDIELLSVDANLLLNGGIATTSHLIASAMVLLLEHPDQMEKLRRDPALVKPMLDEVLRVESPVQFRGRISTRDARVGGVEIPAGSRVLLLFASGNRDEEVFSDGDRFDITRAEVNKHLAFGYGPHFCIGAPLARMEARVAFEQILERLGHLQMAPGHGDPGLIESIFLRAPRSVRLVFDAASPLGRRTSPGAAAEDAA